MKMEKKFFTISCIIIIAISFFTYFTTLNSFFIWSDIEMLSINNTMTDVLQALFMPNRDDATIRPVTELTWFWEYRLWGLNPVGYRIVHLLLHSINSILVLFLSYFLLRNKLVAQGAGLLFAIHPVHAGLSFIYVRYDLMCALFYLLSLVSFTFCVYLKRYRFFYLISIIAYPLALFSKEMAITLPIIIILCDSFLAKRFSLNSFLKRCKYYSPYILFTFLYLFWRLLFTGYIGGDINPVTGRPIFFEFNPLKFIIKVFYIILIKLFIPANISIFSHMITIAFILCTAIAIVIFSFKKTLENKPLILFSFLWVVITLIPVHNIVRIGIAPLSTRLIYLPSVGFCIASAFVILAGKTGRIKRYLSLSIFTIICAIYILVTVKNNSICVQAGEITRGIPRIVNEYYRRYGDSVRYYFLIPGVTRGGVPVFVGNLPEYLSSLFKPISYESVILLCDRDYAGIDAGKNFDLRQPEILQSLGKSIFYFYYNEDKGIFEDLSLPIKLNLMRYFSSSKDLKIEMPALYLSGSIKSIYVYTSQPLHIPAYLIGGIEARMRFKKCADITCYDEGIIRWYKDNNRQPQEKAFSVERDGQFHTYRIPFHIYKPDWTQQDTYVTKIEVDCPGLSVEADFEYVKPFPYQR